MLLLNEKDVREEYEYIAKGPAMPAPIAYALIIRILLNILLFLIKIAQRDS